MFYEVPAQFKAGPGTVRVLRSMLGTTPAFWTLIEEGTTTALLAPVPTGSPPPGWACTTVHLTSTHSVEAYFPI